MLIVASALAKYHVDELHVISIEHVFVGKVIGEMLKESKVFRYYFRE